MSRLKRILWGRKEELNLNGSKDRILLHRMIHTFFKNKKKEAFETEEGKEQRLLVGCRLARVTGASIPSVDVYCLLIQTSRNALRGSPYSQMQVQASLVFLLTWKICLWMNTCPRNGRITNVATQIWWSRHRHGEATRYSVVEHF